VALQRLTKSEWSTCCDCISQGIAHGRRAEVEVITLKLGQRFEAKWVQLHGIVFDPKCDVFEVVIEGLDRLIERPREVYVDATAQGIVALEIVAENEVRQIVRLSEPLWFRGSTNGSPP